MEVSRYNRFRRNCCEVRQVEHRALKELAAARVNDERVREHILSNAGPQVQDSATPQESGRAARGLLGKHIVEKFVFCLTGLMFWECKNRFVEVHAVQKTGFKLLSVVTVTL